MTDTSLCIFLMEK